VKKRAESKNRTLFVIKNRAINSVPDFVEAFTTRIGGVSSPPYGSLNLGTTTGDRRTNVKRNNKIAAGALGFKRIITANQVHGNRVMEINAKTAAKACDEHADALVTAEKSVMIGVKTADCAGIIIADPVNRAVAAVHAGWRGMANKVAGKTVEFMKKRFKSDPKKLIASISPAIGPCCFIIGRPLYARLKKEADFKNIFSIKKKKIYMDMRKGIRNTLARAGLKLANIHTSGFCTSCDEGLFFSYRRDNKETGRMAAVVGIKQSSAEKTRRKG